MSDLYVFQDSNYDLRLMSRSNKVLSEPSESVNVSTTGKSHCKFILSPFEFQHIYQIILDKITLLILQTGNLSVLVLQDINEICIIFLMRFANSIIYYAMTMTV